jgi:hypothetical protein
MRAQNGARAAANQIQGGSMRFTILLCCLVCSLALAGCADSPRPAALSPEPAAAPVSPSAAGRAAQASAKKPDKKNDDWWKEGGVTREKINAMCWMKYEQGRKDMAVEKRADLVDQCVQQTLKEHPLR